MKKRFIALLLCCVMLLTLSPSLISAASATDISGTTQSTEGQVTTGGATNPSDTETSTGLQPDATIGNNPPADPQPDANNGNTSAEVENGGSSEAKSDAVAPEEFTPKAAYNYLVLIQDDEKATKTYLDTLTDEQILALISYLEPQKITEGSLPYLLAYLELRFPPYEFLSCVNDTVAAPLVQAAIPRRMKFRAFTATQNDSGLETSKTVVKNADGSYTLRLEAYATGATYTTETSKPTDIVLVLDTSGSMDDYISVADKSSVANLDPQYANYYKWNGGIWWHDMRYQNGKWQYDSLAGWKDCGDSWLGNRAGIMKIDALKIAVDGFLESTAQNSGDNRVALVTYASGANTVNGLTNDFASVKTSVRGMTANGATYADAGMANAKEIIEKIPAERDSNKVVIMFTDGEPNHGNGFDNNVANATIATSKQMKDAGVTVYTVGVMEGANNADTTSQFNRYMNYVSSNYPDAKNMNNGGTKYEHPDGGNYYLTADNLEALKEIFQSISNEVGGASNSTLDSSTVLKDIISDSFQLPAGADADSIAVYTADCTAINNGTPTFGEDQSSGLSASIAEDGRTITVSGFNYSANYVGQNTTTGELHNPGKKLVVEIPIKVRTGFLGGNNVKTNAAGSGVFKDNQIIESFTSPQVNVPIKDVSVTAVDKNVYLLCGLTAAQLKEGAVVECGDVTLNLDPTVINYGLETWQTEYVDITVEIKDANDNVVSTDLTGLTDDTTYTVAVTVTPKTYGADADGTPATAKDGSGKANINVYKPELTYRDSEVYYGAVAPTKAEYDANNLTGTKWAHKEQDNSVTYSTAVTMIGTAPELTLTYTPDSTKIADGKINTKQNIAVDVAVKINGTDVTTDTTFNHTNCTSKSCTVPEGKEFLLHVKTCSLTITKTGGTDGEPYVFNIYKDGSTNVYTQVTIVPDGDKRSVTIYELPVGTYTIAEDTGWSWRYNADNGSSANLTARNSSGTITCTNSSNGKIYWLNGFSQVVKNIFGVKH